MTKAQIINEIKNILSNDFDRVDIEINETTTIDDLYITSLEMADLILSIEETFGIETPFGNGEFPFATLYEFIDYLVEKINSDE